MTKQALRLDAMRAADTDRSVPLTFEEFFRLERDHLCGTLCLITGDRDEAEELAQEAFTTVWVKSSQCPTVTVSLLGAPMP